LACLMMCRDCFFLALSVIAMRDFSAAHLWAQDITYNIVNYPDSQSGDILSGTIITDGTIGLLTEANMRGGDFTVVTPDATTYTVPEIQHDDVSPGLTATATELYIPYAEGGLGA